MKLPPLFHSLARASSLLLLATAIPGPAPSQPLAANSPDLTPEVRERLTKVAGNKLLPAWQRDLMLHLAHGGGTAAVNSARANARTEVVSHPSDASDGSWAQLVIGVRFHQSTIYDPVRDCIVVFGGEDNSGFRNDVWMLSLAGTPTWTALAPTGTPPSARGYHSAIYDPVRDRMLVFGGSNPVSGFCNDIWALSLAGMPTWTALAPTGPPPSARGSHSAIYDPVRDQMVVFGGANGTRPWYLNDVWTLSLAGTPAWGALTPTGVPPSARSSHSVIYDPVCDRMVVFGGWNGSFFDDAWELSLAGTPAWTALTPTGTPPSARACQAAIYDAVRDQMVVFGGDFGAFRNDAWALSLSGTPAWTQLTPTGTPPSPRAFHNIVYDSVHDRMVVFGGFHNDGIGHFLNDVWALSLAGTPSWAELVTSAPDARYAQSAIYDPVRERVVVFGGFDGYAYRNDVWALSLAGVPTWAALAPAGTPPSPRRSQSAIYDPVRDRMVVFGGRAGTTYCSDVWELSLGGAPTWTALAPTGTPPSPRRSHSAIYDPVRDRMLVFGGESSSTYCSDVWALSLAGTPDWAALAPAGTPPSARHSHSAILDAARDRMVVFGGYDGTSYRDDLWVLSLAEPPTWTAISPGGTSPGGRYGHGAIHDSGGDRMVVFGGYDGSYYNDVWALSLASAPVWTALTSTGTPADGRFWHGLVCDPARDRMVVFGGACSAGLLNDVWALGWGTMTGVDDGTRPVVGHLRPPIPNPFRGTATLSYSIGQAGWIRLDVFEASGRLVRRLVEGERRAGTGTVVWDGRGASGSRLGAGVYFVRLAAAGVCETRKVVLVR